MKKEYKIFPARNYKGKMCIEEKVAVNDDMDHGHAIIICNAKGNKKKAVWVDDNVVTFGGKQDSYTAFHARVPAAEGDYIIEVKRDLDLRTYEEYVKTKIYKVFYVAVNGLLLELVNSSKTGVSDDNERRNINNYIEFGDIAKAVMAAHLKVYDTNYKEKPYCISANKKTSKK